MARYRCRRESGSDKGSDGRSNPSLRPTKIEYLEILLGETQIVATEAQSLRGSLLESLRAPSGRIGVEFSAVELQQEGKCDPPTKLEGKATRKIGDIEEFNVKVSSLP